MIDTPSQAIQGLFFTQHEVWEDTLPASLPDSHTCEAISMIYVENVAADHGIIHVVAGLEYLLGDLSLGRLMTTTCYTVLRGPEAAFTKFEGRAMVFAAQVQVHMLAEQRYGNPEDGAPRAALLTMEEIDAVLQASLNAPKLPPPPTEKATATHPG